MSSTMNDHLPNAETIIVVACQLCKQKRLLDEDSLTCNGILNPYNALAD
ncbi:hypothetical protein AGR9A_Cc10020 [Agrobacterium salinitolerans str. Hayward 0363]|nr:hypothetical protein AGR9A_Cc10020 [Agrobacterium salinitolerans str. Hayward 0363]